MIARVLCVLALVVVLLSGCEGTPTLPVDVHILPSTNRGCEIICKDGIVTIRCPYQGGCKPENEAVCVVENGEIRNRMACCPMYTICRACKCLKDGTYKGYCKDGVCTYRIPIAK
jgi:hypothetical protein